MYIVSEIDEDGQSHYWDVIVSDGQHELLCMAWDKIGDKKFELNVFESRNIKKAKKNEYYLKKLRKYGYDYRVVAEIIDVDKNIMKVFGIVFDYGEPFPAESKMGDFYEFVLIRMDIDIAEVDEI